MVRRAAAVCGVVLLVFAWWVPAAQATFSGRNGRIFFDTPLGAVPSQIFSVKASGGGVLRLTSFSDGSSALNPRVSSNGGRVVFAVQDSSGQSTVWVMNANGTNRHRVSHDGGYDDSHPNWSPDGSRIVFSRCSQFLFTCRLATDEPERQRGSRTHAWVLA